MVTGWRAWKIEETWVDGPAGHPHAHLAGYRLVSVGNDSEFSEWRPGQTRRAECLWVHTQEAEPHVAPAEDCRCGYYAYDSIEACFFAYNFRHEAADVIGEVELSGKVIHTAESYRAEFAYPSRLVVLARPWTDSERRAKELEVYGVPVELRSNPEGRL